MEIMKQEIVLNLEHPDQLVKVSKALSSEMRIDILKMLVDRAMSISEIAEVFYLPVSSACMHTKILEDAGLITLLPKPGLRGTKKLCGIKSALVLVDLFAHRKQTRLRPAVIETMPIGNYSDCDIHPTCGIASAMSYLDFEDSPYGFYSGQRIQASLLWLSTGFLEYKFSNYPLLEAEVESVDFSFEICSEAPGYNNDWPSDITLWINNQRICTFLSRGDYGDHRGALNPLWWSDSLTQYGELKYLTVTNSGCLLDSKKVSDHTLKSLNLQKGYFLSLKIGVEQDAVHIGGMNLFGKSFGDHPQDINMKVSYRETKADGERTPLCAPQPTAMWK